MHSIIAAGVISTMVTLSPPVKELSPERIQELVKKLEEPTRSMTDQRRGPPDYPWPTFNYRWHIEEIAELKQAGDVAVPALFALLGDKSKPGQVRAHAAAILMQRLVGTKVKPDQKIIVAINTVLKDNDPALRNGVLSQLMRYGLARSRETWERLKSDKTLEVFTKEMLPPEEWSFTPEVMDALLPGVIAALADEHAEVAISAAGTIEWFGRPDSGVPELLLALKRKEPEVRTVAAVVLSQIGKGNTTVALAVIEQIDPKQPVRIYARVIGAVGQFGQKANAAVPQLIEALQDKRKDTDLYSLHDNAAHALGAIGPDAKDAIPSLLACLATQYYPEDVSATEIYLGSKDEILAALDRIDSEVGKKARVGHKWRMEAYYRWLDSKSPSPIPNLPERTRPFIKP